MPTFTLNRRTLLTGTGALGTAGCEQADGARGDGAGEQGTTVESESGH